MICNRSRAVDAEDHLFRKIEGPGQWVMVTKLISTVLSFSHYFKIIKPLVWYLISGSYLVSDVVRYERDSKELLIGTTAETKSYP